MIETVYRVRCSGPCRRYLTPDGPERGDYPDVLQFDSTKEAYEAARKARWLREGRQKVMCPRCHHAADLREAAQVERGRMRERLQELLADDPALLEKLKAAMPLTNQDLPLMKRLEQVLGKTPHANQMAGYFMMESKAIFWELAAERAEVGDPEYPDVLIAGMAYEARWCLHELELGKRRSWPPDEEWKQRDEPRRGADLTGTQWDG